MMMIRTRTKTQAKKANFMNYFSKFFNLVYNAVSFSVSNLFSLMPLDELAPTQQTTALH